MRLFADENVRNPIVEALKIAKPAPIIRHGGQKEPPAVDSRGR